MKRVGLLGGTFNPIHVGHLAMAQIASEKLRLDKVIFVPCHIPPHKTIRGLVSAQNRFNMVRLAIKDYPRFEVSDCEILRKGKSYTIDTVRHFQDTLPKKTKLLFIIGEDALGGLDKWKDSKKLQKLVSFIVVNRPGCQSRAKVKGKFKFVNMPDIDIASSFLRKCITDGKSIKYFVSDNVYRYIKRHHLYATR